MKIVIAPDSFKESMNAMEAALSIQSAVHHYDSTIETICTPLADGGEGTLETLVYAMQGIIKTYQVTGPLFEPIEAPIGYVGEIAIIECAKVCGLELLLENQKNPYHTTTYGLGELIIEAMHAGAKKLMICLGGSATNDGGIGMLAALGVRFYNQQKCGVKLTMQGLVEICDIDISHINPMIQEVQVIGVCDVKNPLCGKQGATYIYGGQKGVLLEDMPHIDQNMEKYARLVDQYYGCDYRFYSGAGAAGGLGYALLAFCQGTLQPGFDIVSKVVALETHIATCDKVIVGEGKIDRQTQYGKTPYGVLKIAQKYHKDVFAFAGKIEDRDILKKLGFKNVYSITPEDMALAYALKNGRSQLEKCVFKHMEEIIHEI